MHRLSLARVSPLAVLAFVVASAAVLGCTSEPREATFITQESLKHKDGDDDNDACEASKILQRAALAGDDESDEGDGDDHGEAGDVHRGNPAVEHGRKAFNDRRLKGLGGNGRACADCHMASDHFQLSPASAQARWDVLQACRAKNPDADDPLFRPVDATDFRTNGAKATDFSNVKRGLIRITFALPPNVKLLDEATGEPTAETQVDVWRAVPTINNVAITGADTVGVHGDNGQADIGPNPRGGYQLDGRVLTLPAQALGALINHAQVATQPAQSFLEDIAAFQSTQFSSPAVADLAKVILAGGTTFPTTTPDLTALEQEGKVTFDRVCATCHGAADHPSGSTPTIGQRYHRIRSQCPRQPARTPAQSLSGLPEEQQFGDIQFPACDAGTTANSRIYAFVGPTGIITNKQRSDDIGRAFFTGRFSDANAFDVPSLHGISQTAPYFHNNSAATLEDMVEFYRVLFPAVARDFRVGALPAIVSTDGKQFDRFFTSAEAPGLVAYLKRL